MNINKQFLQRVITASILGLAFWVLFLYLPSYYFSYVLLAILLQIIFFEWHQLFHMTSPFFWIVLPLYPVLPFALLIYLNNHPVYHQLLLILFILVSSHDTGSYIIGTLCGKRTIYPRISPKKTWEGFLGGCFFAVIGLALILWERGSEKPWWFIAGFATIISTLSIMGDFFESWLKRRAGVKDTGSILPGHGGFLDRFDGILFAVFFFYLFRDCLTRLFVA